MTTRRMLPPVGVAYQTLTVNGRSYTGSPGSAYDIVDFDAAVLSANGWIDCGLSGPTSARPTATIGHNALSVGLHFTDTTISGGVGVLIFFDGANWRTVSGATA